MASFGKKLKKAAKKVGRVHAKVFAKTVKVVAPIVSAVATVYAGPVGGLAVTGALAGASRYAGATAARAKGLKGTAARKKGRSLARQVLKYGALGTGVGAIGGAIATGSVMGALGGTSGLFGALKSSTPTLNREARDFKQMQDDYDAKQNQTTEYEHVGIDGPQYSKYEPGLANTDPSRSSADSLSSHSSSSSPWSSLALGALGVGAKAFQNRLTPEQRSLGSSLYNQAGELPYGNQLQSGLSDLGFGAPPRAEQEEEGSGSKLLKYAAIAGIAFVALKAGKAA